MLAVCTERDVCLRCQHAVDLVEPVGDNVRDLFVVAYSNKSDQVDLARDAVDLAYSLELRDLLGYLWDALNSRLNEDDRGDHSGDPIGRGPTRRG